ncbi:MAG: PrsW family glutamic-type intramembrane protease [bacterium]
MLLPLVALALAPVLTLAGFFYFRGRHRQESVWPLLLTFVLGAAVLAPAVVTAVMLQRLTGWYSGTPSLLGRFAGALLIVGLVEEGWKFVVVRLYAWARPEFDEPYDGISYSVMAALGFATVENLLYVLGGGFQVGVLRALLTVPGHAFFGMLMGYFLGEAKFAGTPGRSAGLQLAGLGLAVLAHGVYDFIVFALDLRPLMLLVLPVYSALTWVIFFRATRRQAGQSFRRRADLRELSGRD